MGNKIQNFGIFSLLFFIFLEEKRGNCVNFGLNFTIMPPLRGYLKGESQKSKGEIYSITNYELRGQNHNRLIYK